MKSVSAMNPSPEQTEPSVQLDIDASHSDTATLAISGSWRLDRSLPDAAELKQSLAVNTALKHLGFRTENLHDWDSGLMTFLVKVFQLAEEAGMSIDTEGLPEGAQRLLKLVAAAQKRPDAAGQKVSEKLLTRIGGG